MQHLYFNYYNTIYQISELNNVKTTLNYWYLYAIGKIFFEDGTNFTYCSFYFISKKEPNDKFKNFRRNKKVKINLDASLMIFFYPGCIFSKEGYLIYSPENYITASGYINIDFDRCQQASKGLFLDDNFRNQYPTLPQEQLNEFFYFTQKITKDGRDIHAIVPCNVICNYLYFKTIYITTKLLNYDFYFSIESTANGIGQLLFDSANYIPEEINYLAPYLFINDSNGIKSLNLIGSHLKKSMFENSDGAFLQTIIPFDCENRWTARGQEIMANGVSYFLVHDIQSLKLDTKSIFSIDRIVLKPNGIKRLNFHSLLLKKQKLGLNRDVNYKQVPLKRISNKTLIKRIYHPTQVNFGIDIDVNNDIEEYYRSYFHPSCWNFPQENLTQSVYENLIDKKVHFNFIIETIEYLNNIENCTSKFCVFNPNDETSTYLRIYEKSYELVLAEFKLRDRYIYILYITEDNYWLFSNQIRNREFALVDLQIFTRKIILDYYLPVKKELRSIVFRNTTILTRYNLKLTALNLEKQYHSNDPDYQIKREAQSIKFGSEYLVERD